VSQTGIIRLKSVEVSGVDHPLSPVEFGLKSKLAEGTVVGSGDLSHTLYFKYERKCPQVGDQLVDFLFRLQGTNIQSTAKPVVFKDLAKGLATKATSLDINTVVTNLFSRFQESGDMRKKILGRFKEVADIAGKVTEEVLPGGISNINVTWGVEIGDCMVEYLQKDEDGKVRNVGHVKLSNMNKAAMGDALKETETQLIQSKMDLAMISSEKFDLQTQVSQTTDKMAKLREELDSISKKLADSKFQMAQMQEENDNLKSELKKAKAGAGGSAAPSASAQASAAAGKVAGGVRGLFGNKGK